jgi:hypothetical protein
MIKASKRGTTHTAVAYKTSRPSRNGTFRNVRPQHVSNCLSSRMEKIRHHGSGFAEGSLYPNWLHFSLETIIPQCVQAGVAMGDIHSQHRELGKWDSRKRLLRAFWMISALFKTTQILYDPMKRIQSLIVMRPYNP